MMRNYNGNPAPGSLEHAYDFCHIRTRSVLHAFLSCILKLCVLLFCMTPFITAILQHMLLIAPFHIQQQKHADHNVEAKAYVGAVLLFTALM